MARDLVDKIDENAKGPAEVTGDSNLMKQHPLRDQIEDKSDSRLFFHP